jgi:hypothetical protein
LVLLALATRVVYNVVVLRDYSPLSDAHHYHDLAASVADGDGFAMWFPFPDDQPQATAFRPPAYPLLLAGFYAVLGAHIGVAQVLNIGLGVGVVLLAVVVATRIAGPQAGFAAGVLVAVYPPLLANDGPPLAEPLSLGLMLLTVLALLDGRLVAAGVATGLQVLTKPSAQGLALVLAVWVLWRFGWRRTLTFAVPVVLVVTPWVVRNWVVMGSPVLVTSNGFNLAALYSPQSHAADAWLDPSFDPRFEEVRREAVAEEDEVAWDQALRRLALDGLRDHPLDVVSVAGENTLRLLELAPIENEAGELLDGRNLGFRYATLWTTWLVLPAGMAGLLWTRRHHTTQLLALTAIYFTLIGLPLSPMAPRLRAPLDVACCIGVAVLVAHYMGRWRAPAVTRDETERLPIVARSRAAVDDELGRSRVSAP